MSAVARAGARPLGAEPEPARAGVRAAAGGPRARRGVLVLERPLPLELGGALDACRIGWALYGDPALPTVVALGGISAGRHLAACAADPRPGWWQDFVGTGLAVDTRRFSVLGIDFLGGSGASTGAAGPGFPSITTADQASALAAVLDHLGISVAHAVVGSSYGGMVALAFGERFPGRAARLVVISAAHESHPMATALRTLQRRAVRLGVESGRERDGLAIARGIAMTTYRTAEEFAARFGGAPERTTAGPRFPVEDYLEQRGEAFARAFSPWSFLCLSESIDLHRVDPAAVATPTTLVGVDSDTLVPPWQLRPLAAALAGPAALVELQSVFGHDAFLKEVGAVSRIVRDALHSGGES
ncbi:MAG TPA: homoserine O-succinyltransferase [Longimicrobiales bacterium]|nr:homoserine O-succinyltransferase [Longimicrobiales bacterium]